MSILFFGVIIILPFIAIVYDFTKNGDMVLALNKKLGLHTDTTPTST